MKNWTCYWRSWKSRLRPLTRTCCQQQRFRIVHDERGVDLLPTAATCFNTLRLPPYPSAAVLGDKLRLALSSSAGFDEGAVAE